MSSEEIFKFVVDLNISKETIASLGVGGLKQLKEMVYDSLYGNFNHFDSNVVKDKPLALNELHDNEDVLYNNGYRRRFRTFIKNKMAELLNISFSEYLTMPRHIQRALLDVIELEAKEKEKRDELMKAESDKLKEEAKLAKRNRSSSRSRTGK